MNQIHSSYKDSGGPRQRGSNDTGNETSKNKTAISEIELPGINLPKGGGAIRGIEEKFQVNAVTGTVSFSIPLPITSSRGAPTLGLTYNSGAGNSAFGLGWQLTAGSIVRKTEKRLPQYRDEEESDIYMMSGSEDLVPVLEKQGNDWVEPVVPPRNVDGINYTIKRYRPRIEGSFSRIERWKNIATGEVHWRVIAPNNIQSYYGLTPESRISDPNDPLHVYEWLLSKTHDDKGSIALYTYKKEDFAGVPNEVYEKNRIGNCTQTYLKKILYGNKATYYPGDAIPAENDFMFRVVFDYGEHDTTVPIPQTVFNEVNTWTSRKDAFSDHRPGFELRTYRRCKRVMMFHCFSPQELPISPYLTQSLELFYDEDLDFSGSGKKETGFSYLIRARQNGHKWNAAANRYDTKSMPEIEISYQQHEWDTTTKFVTEENIIHAPAGLDDRRYLWFDLFSEGIAGMLTEQGGAWYYKSNLGNGEFSRADNLSPLPSLRGLTDGTVMLQELKSDGSVYLTQLNKDPKGYFKLDDDSEWQPMQTFRSMPNLATDDPNLRLIDLTGDGMADIMVMQDDSIQWYESLGEEGFSVSNRVQKEIEEEKGPAILFNDSTKSIFLTDMSGDGLTDIVRIRNGEVCYWPNLGYGRFGKKVSMGNAPVFDHPDLFNPIYLRLCDIDGSGTTDLVYLGKNDFRVWMNHNGNEWNTQPHVISAFPAIHNLADVAVLDFLGSGTGCIVYSTQVGSQPLWYIDIMKGKKPHLMTGYINNCGSEVTLQYRSSTQYYLDDKKQGRKWITKLPFPVHCIAGTRIEDKIRRTVYTCSYKYSHGYFDHQEREFRGFGRVEQLDAEDFSTFKLNNASNVVEEPLHQAPVRTISWFHTGSFIRNKKILHQYSDEYFKNGAFAEYPMPDAVFPANLSIEEIREAYRTCKGFILRSEVYADDNLPESKYPFSVSMTGAEVKLIQGKGKNRNACLLLAPSESISYYYEREPADPRIGHSFTLETDDFGLVLKTASVVYKRLQRPVGPNAIPDKVWEEQNKCHIVHQERKYTDDIIEDDNYRLRVNHESKGYEIGGIDIAPGAFITKNVLLANINAAAEIGYDEEFTGGFQKRLSSQSRSYFMKDDLTGGLALGKLSKLAIPYKSHRLVFTPGLVTKLYGAKVTPLMLTDAKYIHSEGDLNWWIPSGDILFPANAKDKFYTPTGSRDLFGNESHVEYDNYFLALRSSTDAINNTVTGETDYRTLMPVLVTDANMNRSAVETDELGMVIKTAVMGKAGAGEGDTLADPTSRIEYELFNWKNNGKPNYVHVLTREKHGAANPRWQEMYTYSDGGGSVIMMKVQAEPGKAKKWNTVTKVVDEVDADPRWVGNGRTIVNNKGNAIKQFDPYFSTTHEFESEDALVETGFSSIVYYDATGRNTHTDYPNGTFSKTEFDPWHSKIYDAIDTVKDSQWYIDRGSPNPAVDPEPLNDQEKRAAWQAAKHYNTPSILYSDSLGKGVYSVTDHGGGKTTHTHSESDALGRVTILFDQLDREVSRRLVNMTGAMSYGTSAEKGKKWVFGDAMGRVVKMWDNAREFRTSFDNIHRPISAFMKENGNEILYNHIYYGDNLVDAVQKNLKGKAYMAFDQSGVATVTSVDFKGNILAANRCLTKEYKLAINWQALENLTVLNDVMNGANPLLENEQFSSVAEMDALNRPTKMTLPDLTVLLPLYNIGNMLDSMQVQFRGQGNSVQFLINQDFDAKGKRQFVKYGNGAITNYTYDPKTFQLIRVLTKMDGSADATALQDLHYTYDPGGNIVYTKDDAQQTHFFANAVVKPESFFEYDAIYQLRSASGRELAAIGNSDAQPDNNDLSFVGQLPHINNANAVRIYTEKYDYDDVGNISRMRHTALNANWTRNYHYAYQDNPGDRTNRLASTSLPGDPAGGPYTALYVHDARGNLTSMPHLAAINSLIWDFNDTLKEVNLGGGGRAYYVYGAGGNRIRKIIERPGGKRIERIYLGVIEIYREYQNNNKRFERNTIHVSDNGGRIAQIDTKLLDLDNVDPNNALNADLVRYQYGNHLGSATLETDENGVIISYEEFHPFGTSSYRNNKNNVDISLKRYRFCGKEKDDETGFYYFGARYYAPWLGRWISCDPAGFVRGFNLFRYCSNSPIVFYDPNGMQDSNVVVRDTRLGPKVDFSTIQQNVPAGYHIKSDVNAQNFRTFWNARTGVYDILERDNPVPSGASGLNEAGQRAITANPEGPTIEVPNNFDQPKIDAMEERILDPNDRQIGNRSESNGQRTDDIRAANQGQRNAFNDSLPPNQRASRANNIDIDHTVELQHIIRQDNPADEIVRPQDHRPQNAGLNRSQGRGARTVADRQTTNNIPEDVPAGGVARSQDIDLLANSPRLRTAARAAGFGLMAAGPVLNFWASSHVKNDAVRYTGYGLSSLEGIGVGMYAVGRWGMNGASGLARGASGLRVMGLGSGLARYTGGAATIVLSTYSLVTDYQAGEYGVMLGDTAGIVAGGAMLAGSGPVAAIAGGVALSNGVGNWVEQKVTPELGRPAGVASGTLAGAAVGAAAGAAIGVIFFGVGAAPGAAIGAGVGALAGFIGAMW